MWVLKGAAMIVAVLIAVALVAGAGFVIASALAIGGALMALFAIGTFVVLAATDFYDSVFRRHKRR